MPVVRVRKKRRKSLGRRLRKTCEDIIERRTSWAIYAYMALAFILALVASNLFMRFISK